MHTSHWLLSTLTACLSLSTLVASFPATDQRSSNSKRNTPAEQSVFFDITRSDVEARIDKLKADGFRPTSLSIYGSPNDPKYAGIWTKQDGNPYEISLGISENAFNSWVERLRGQGYTSMHVAATGPPSSSVFVGVMEQIPSVPGWTQDCGVLDPYAWMETSRNSAIVIKAVSMYGMENNRRYCILGHANTNNQQQVVYYQTDSNKYDYKKLETEETSKRFWRPSFIHISEDNLLTPIFEDTSVGEWVIRTDLTASQLESEIAAQRKKNMHAIHISGAGSSDSKFVMIFAEQLTPLGRDWHATGNVTGFRDNKAVSDALDKVMQDFMQKNGVRQAQVAAAVNGSVVASRAYTLAESNRAVTQPSDMFMLASVSKAFTYAAVDHLISTGRLNLTTRVYPLLGYNQPADPRSLDITVQHLLDHTAGFDEAMSPNIGLIFTTVAQSLRQSTPATIRQVIEYLYGRQLDFTPGARSVYSNYGTMLLGYVITNLTNETYMSYLQKNVLNGLKVEVYETAADKHVNDRIVQETKLLGVSALTPQSDVKVPQVHGGDGSIKEEAVGSIGLKASAETIARFLGNHAAYGLGGRVPGQTRDGTLAGGRAMAVNMEQLDWALNLNTRQYLSEEWWDRLVKQDVQDIFRNAELA